MEMDTSTVFSSTVQGWLRVRRRATDLAAVVLGIRFRLPSPLTSRAERADVLHEATRKLVASHGIRSRVTGELPKGPCVIVANHLSYIDPIVLASLGPCTAVAKIELLSWPLMGRALAEMGVIFVRRGDTGSGAVALRKALRSLRAGVSVVNFPEGTTSAGGDVLPFLRGIFGIARIANVPVVPIALRLVPRDMCWVGDATFLPHYAKLVARSDNAVEMTIGKALSTDGKTSDALAREAEACLRELLGATESVSSDVSYQAAAE
jgi:1-acyl-sn-glycerol-3-phosphate acyltransferase